MNHRSTEQLLDTCVNVKMCVRTILVTFALFNCCTAIYNPIYKLYSLEGENISSEHFSIESCDDNFSSFKKEYNILSEGLPLILWQMSLPPSPPPPFESGIQEKCMTDFLLIQSSMKNGSLQALKCEYKNSHVTWFNLHNFFPQS